MKDLYFDDVSWVIRYIVADTSIWLCGRKVPISPYSIGRDANAQLSDVIPVRLTKSSLRTVLPSMNICRYPGNTNESITVTIIGLLIGVDRMPAGDDEYPMCGPGPLVNSAGAVAGDDAHLRSMNEVGSYDLQ